MPDNLAIALAVCLAANIALTAFLHRKLAIGMKDEKASVGAGFDAVYKDYLGTRIDIKKLNDKVMGLSQLEINRQIRGSLKAEEDKAHVSKNSTTKRKR